MKLTQHTAKIWTIDSFLSERECDDLIIMAEQMGFEEATVSLPKGAQMIKGIRNNYRLISSNPVLARSLWSKLAPFCPEQIEGWDAIGLNERFRFYRYESDQRFKRHIDGRHQKNLLEQSRITFMIYLNDDFEGGETKFDEVEIIPKKGAALCFIHEQKHEGCPVQNGSKYVLRSDIMYKKK